MPEAVKEDAVMHYIAERADELMALINYCPPSEKVQFLTYLLGMVRIEAEAIFCLAVKSTPTLVFSREKNSPEETLSPPR